HCIPADPLYLSWKVRLTGYEAQFIALADQVNRAMPEHVVNLMTEARKDRGLALRGASVLVLGVTYNAQLNESRAPPALELVELTANNGGRVWYSDPFIPQLTIGGVKLASAEPTPEAIESADCVLLLTNHTSFDNAMIAKRAKLVVDTRNALKQYRRDHPAHAERHGVEA